MDIGMVCTFTAWTHERPDAPPRPQVCELWTPRSDRIVVRVLYCGVCGSDVHLSRGEWEAQFPAVLGHEIVGVVTQVPSAATRPGLEVGRLVGIGWQNEACGQCEQCGEERPYHCDAAAFTCYQNGGEGGFAEYVRANPAFVVPIPEALHGDLARVAPLMCGGLTVYRPLSEHANGSKKTLLVAGLGGLGTMAVAFGRHLYSKVVVVSTTPTKAEAARRLGADAFYTWDTLPSSPIADVVLVCASAKFDLPRLCQAIRPLGVVKIVGISSEALALSAEHVVNADITVAGSNLGSPAMLEDMLYFAAKHRVLPEITLRRPEEIGTTLEELKDRTPARRFVIQFASEQGLSPPPPLDAVQRRAYRLVEDATVGVRLVATKRCAAGETFDTFRCLPSRDCTQHSMWDALRGQHYVARHEAECIPFMLEHQIQPNLRVDPQCRRVVAVRAIQPGEFLSLDYTETERRLFAQFPLDTSEAPLLRPWTSGAEEPLSDAGKQWLGVDTASQGLLASCHVAYRNDHLWFQNIDLFRLAASNDADIPTFVYSKQALRLNLYRITQAMRTHFHASTLYFSVKANSSRAILCELRHAGQHHLDVCSPQELERARECGFAVERMQYTGTGLSDADLRILGRHPSLRINCDSISMLERVPHTRHVGLRLDPNVGMSYQSDERLQCTCSSKPTKMGIPICDVPQACAVATRRGITLERLHVHVGNSFQSDDLKPFDQILTQVERAVALCHDNGFDIAEVNLGGGYGVPYLPSERTFDWDVWAERVKQHPTLCKLRIQIEPGDAIVKNAGVLLTRVTDVVTKDNTRFVSLNAGMNLNPLPAYYGIASFPYPVVRRHAPNARVDVVGNLNESIDVWRADVDTTPILAGDHIALLNCGGYAQSCRTTHSLRCAFASVLH